MSGSEEDIRVQFCWSVDTVHTDLTSLLTFRGSDGVNRIMFCGRNGYVGVINTESHEIENSVSLSSLFYVDDLEVNDCYWLELLVDNGKPVEPNVVVSCSDRVIIFWNPHTLKPFSAIRTINTHSGSGYWRLHVPDCFGRHPNQVKVICGRWGNGGLQLITFNRSPNGQEFSQSTIKDFREDLKNVGSVSTILQLQTEPNNIAVYIHNPNKIVFLSMIEERIIRSFDIFKETIPRAFKSVIDPKSGKELLICGVSVCSIYVYDLKGQQITNSNYLLENNLKNSEDDLSFLESLVFWSCLPINNNLFLVGGHSGVLEQREGSGHDYIFSYKIHHHLENLPFTITNEEDINNKKQDQKKYELRKHQISNLDRKKFGPSKFNREKGKNHFTPHRMLWLDPTSDCFAVATDIGEVIVLKLEGGCALRKVGRLDTLAERDVKERLEYLWDEEIILHHEFNFKMIVDSKEMKLYKIMFLL